MTTRVRLLLLCGALLTAISLQAASVTLLLPLNRTAYQTNELIDLSVVRSDAAALNAGTLQLQLVGEDGSKLAFSFPVAAVPLAGADARTTEHLHLNGWLLRPGRYQVNVTADGATLAKPTTLELYSHVRKSTYRIIDWGSTARGADIAKLGEDGMGFNLLYASAGGDDSIRGGLDYMGCCMMSGGHQMDLRAECDWSDPYVLQGAKERVVRTALLFRTTPNAIGVHFYDEPGLTWMNGSPHDLPPQIRSYQGAFGVAPQRSTTVKADDPASIANWKQFGTWKLGFMDAAWKDAQQGVSAVRPDFLSVTQSQYGYMAFTDGYYFNVARSLPVTSGHGGYDEWGGYLNPYLCLEAARARDLSKPNWYLPDWDNIPSTRFRLEQYTCFMLGLQGLAKPPSIGMQNPAGSPTSDGVVESNKTALRLGTIFNTMPAPRPPVAVLYSISHLLDAQTKKMSVYYSHQDPHGTALNNVLNAGILDQQRIITIADEDIIDGTAAQYHKVIILPAINYLDPKVIKGLQDFMAGGGKVYLTGECGLQLDGAVKLTQPSTLPDDVVIKQLNALGRTKEADPKNFTTGKAFLAVTPFAKVLKAQLLKDGIAPVIESSNPEIAAARAAYGDIEYVFAVNVKYDEAEGAMNSIKATTATISLPDDGRPLYDAMIGGPAQGFAKAGGKLTANFRWGAGQMRAYARTARPIGGVAVATPVVSYDLTQTESPIALHINAVLLDAQNGILVGSAPLQITVTDPLGAVRYDLFRATDQGMCHLNLPLAANDPTGKWTVTVTELLSNTHGSSTCTFAVPGRNGAVAGATQRAVIFGNDRDHLFNFFRTHQNVTLVTGLADYDRAAAARLAESLKPWDVRCQIVNAADVNKSRDVSPEEAPTLCAIDFAGGGQIKAGTGNSPALVGYAVQGPVVLFGTPEDNPLIKDLVQQKVLPYALTPDFPGRGHGLLAWQLDILGHNQESIACIAYDATGMGEAVGSLYEAAAGLTPLTPMAQPSDASIVAANLPAKLLPAVPITWQTLLPDRAVALAVLPNGDITVATQDGSVSTLAATGKLLTQREAGKGDVPAPNAAVVIPDPVKKQLLPARVVKYCATTADGVTAVAYWGGTLQLFTADGVAITQQMLPQDAAGLAWDKTQLVVGLADGRILALTLPTVPQR